MKSRVHLECRGRLSQTTAGLTILSIKKAQYILQPTYGSRSGGGDPERRATFSVLVDSQELGGVACPPVIDSKHAECHSMNTSIMSQVCSCCPSLTPCEERA